jgi:hypothetical protein
MSRHVLDANDRTNLTDAQKVLLAPIQDSRPRRHETLEDTDIPPIQLLIIRTSLITSILFLGYPRKILL